MNQDDDRKTIRFGQLYGGFSPLKSKRTYYGVLYRCVLELHESERSQKKKKEPKVLIDLATCFNFDTKLKECVCVMTPDETIILRADIDTDTNEWYESIMSATMVARATKLGRSVTIDEFFENAWDITVTKYPKLKKPPLRTENIEDLCAKNPMLIGERRLCFYPHSIVICQLRIEPTAVISDMPKSGLPPFRSDDFIEFPMAVIANFGKQEKYFFMRTGRSAVTGSGELWMLGECGEIVTDMHRKLNQILERESEKRRQYGSGIRAAADIDQHRKSSTVTISGGVYASPQLLTFQRRHQAPARCHSVGATCQPNVNELLSQLSNIDKHDHSSVVDHTLHANDGVVQCDDEDEEDSGGTLRNVQPTISTTDQYMSMDMTNDVSESSCDSKHQDYLSMEPDSIKLDNLDISNAETNHFDDDYTRMLSNTPPSTQIRSGSSHLTVPNAGSDHWNLDEIRSYVSDSSDSCSSSLLLIPHTTTTSIDNTSGSTVPATQRTYSFGSHPPNRSDAHRSSIIDARGTVVQHMMTSPLCSSASSSLNDPRKRAYSLGNKSFFGIGRPYRKISSATLKKSRNDAIDSPESMYRCDSFESGSSTPSSRKRSHVRSSQQMTHHNDLIELDFGRSMTTGGYGSSLTQSPVRSRTNSGGASCTVVHNNVPIRHLPSSSFDEKPSDRLISDMLRESMIIVDNSSQQHPSLIVSNSDDDHLVDDYMTMTND